MDFESQQDSEATLGPEVVESLRWTLARSRLFEGAGEDALDVAARTFSFTRRSPGDLIYRQGDAGNRIFIVKRGRIWLRRRIDTRVTMPIAIVTGGDMFGEETLFEDAYTVSAESLVETLLMSAATSDVRPLLAQSAIVARNVAATFAGRLSGTFALLHGLANGPIVASVIDRLESLRPAYGVDVFDGILLDIELGAEDIAALASSSPAAVASALAFLERIQFLRINGPSITLLNALLPPPARGEGEAGDRSSPP